jgi:hypothetical protein
MVKRGLYTCIAVDNENNFAGSKAFNNPLFFGHQPATIAE